MPNESSKEVLAQIKRVEGRTAIAVEFKSILGQTREWTLFLNEEYEYGREGFVLLTLDRTGDKVVSSRPCVSFQDFLHLSTQA